MSTFTFIMALFQHEAHLKASKKTTSKRKAQPTETPVNDKQNPGSAIEMAPMDKDRKRGGHCK
jgi:hypothetical protein